MPIDLDVTRREITALAIDINRLRDELAAKGITDIDTEDRMEALDIINRIERRMLANMPTREAAE